MWRVFLLLFSEIYFWRPIKFVKTFRKDKKYLERKSWFFFSHQCKPYFFIRPFVSYISWPLMTACSFFTLRKRLRALVDWTCFIFMRNYCIFMWKQFRIKNKLHWWFTFDGRIQIETSCIPRIKCVKRNNDEKSIPEMKPLSCIGFIN